MAYRRESEPSPLRTGVVHAGMSLAVFGGLATSLGLGIHVTSDPAAASPSQTIALFDTVEYAAKEPVRAARLTDPGEHPGGDFLQMEPEAATAKCSLPTRRSRATPCASK